MLSAHEACELNIIIGGPNLNCTPPIYVNLVHRMCHPGVDANQP